MLDDEDGEAGVLGLDGEQVEKEVGGRLVEVAGGFVEQEDLGFERQHAGDGEALFPAQRERCYAAVAHGVEAEEVEPTAQFALAVNVGRLLLEAEGNFLFNGFAEELDFGVLEDDAGEAFRAGAGAVAALEPEGARAAAEQCDVVEAGEVEGESSLARP